jgi:hypothetical protein
MKMKPPEIKPRSMLMLGLFGQNPWIVDYVIQTRFFLRDSPVYHARTLKSLFWNQWWPCSKQTLLSFNSESQSFRSTPADRYSDRLTENNFSFCISKTEYRILLDNHPINPSDGPLSLHKDTYMLSRSSLIWRGKLVGIGRVTTGRRLVKLSM